MNQDSLSTLEAYAAAFYLITNYNKYLQSEDINDLLSAMQLLPDKKSVDPALWSDWCKVVERAKSGELPFIQLTK